MRLPFALRVIAALLWKFIRLMAEFLAAVVIVGVIGFAALTYELFGTVLVWIFGIVFVLLLVLLLITEIVDVIVQCRRTEFVSHRERENENTP